MDREMMADKPQNGTQAFRKTIGKTTYNVSMHFKENGSTGVEERLKRVVLHDLTDKNTVPQG